jgi:hypothetical protein
MSEITVSYVTPDEILYRRVPDDPDLYKLQEDGTVIFKTLAFTDVDFRTSVDRAKLCDNDPRRTAAPVPGSGVVSLVTSDVRAIEDVIQYDKKQKPLVVFEVDVKHVPIIDDPIEPDNPAHAEIHTKPECPNRSVFKRLREKLVLLANHRQWELKPSSLSQERGIE